MVATSLTSNVWRYRTNTHIISPISIRNVAIITGGEKQYSRVDDNFIAIMIPENQIVSPTFRFVVRWTILSRMALEFTNIPDRTGPAVYIFGDGTSQTETQLLDFARRVDDLTPDETQVVYLDPARGDGLAVKEFYGITSVPYIMIVMDDDTIPYSWQSMPQPDEVSYALSQISGSMD